MRFLRLILVSLWAVLPSLTAWGESTPAERLEEDPLILEMRLGHRILSDALLAYPRAEGLLLPLQEVMIALELPIIVDSNLGTAEGWFLSENRRFFLDLYRQEVLIAGQFGEYADRRIKRRDNDIYVDTILLAQWFPIDFEIRLQRSQVLIRSREKLPIERKIERRRQWQRSQGDWRFSDPIRHPRQPLPYRLFAWPAIDHKVSWSIGQDGKSEELGGLRSNLLATGDLLMMSAELAMALSEEGFGGQLKVGRQDPDARLLGPLQATSFQVGDLFTAQRPLISRQRLARGIEISSFPLDRPQLFDRTSLRGDALPGWDLELYHNDQLIDFFSVGENGRYEFVDIPIDFGLNVLRLVFHGPHGQRREEIKRLLIDEDLIQTGKSYYRLAVHQQERQLFSHPEEEVFEGVENPEYDRRGRPRYFFELERGLRQNLSLSLSLNSLPLANRRHTYASVGLLAARKGIFTNAYLVADTAGGWAGQLALEVSLPRANLKLEHQQFFDYLSEETRLDDPLMNRSVLEIGSRPRSMSPMPFTLSVTAEQQQHRSGAYRHQLMTRLGANLKPVSFQKTLQFSQQQNRGAQTRKFGGSLLLAARSRHLAVRGGLRYEIIPQLEAQDIQLSAEWRLNRNLHSRLNIRHGLSDNFPDSYLASLSRRFETFALSLDARFDDRGGISSGLSVSYSLGREPFSGRWQTRSRPLASQGFAATRVFLDHNQNHRFDPGEEPLEGIRFAVNGNAHRMRTNSDGIALLDGLAPNHHTNLELDIRSLEDPFWVPERQGVGLISRPGQAAQIDFPVIISGEVDGTVFLEKDGERQVVSQAELQLVDLQGEIHYQVSSTFDGFYLFDRVVPGRYRLRVNPDQAVRLKLQTPPPRDVVIETDELVVSGVDLTLQRLDS